MGNNPLTNVGGFNQISGDFTTSTSGAINLNATGSNNIQFSTATSEMKFSPKGVTGTTGQLFSINANGGLGFVDPILNTDDLPEGGSNLYFTEARVNTNTLVANAIQKNDTLTYVATKNDLQNLGGSQIIDTFRLTGLRLEFSLSNDNEPLKFVDLGNIQDGNGLADGNIISLGDLDMQTSFKVKNLPNPTNAGDAATKAYVDSQVGTGGGGETDPVYSVSQAANIINSGSGLVITTPERNTLNSALQQSDVTGLVTDGDNSPVSSDAVHDALTRIRRRWFG